jgi:hypothetical protein
MMNHYYLSSKVWHNILSPGHQVRLFGSSKHHVIFATRFEKDESKDLFSRRLAAINALVCLPIGFVSGLGVREPRLLRCNYSQQWYLGFSNADVFDWAPTRINSVLFYAYSFAASNIQALASVGNIIWHFCPGQ